MEKPAHKDINHKHEVVSNKEIKALERRLKQKVKKIIKNTEIPEHGDLYYQRNDVNIYVTKDYSSGRINEYRCYYYGREYKNTNPHIEFTRIGETEFTYYSYPRIITNEQKKELLIYISNSLPE